MKSYLLILGMIVFSINTYAEESNKYIFGGFNFGVSTIDSTVQSETNNKNGSFYGATFGYEHKFKSKTLKSGPFNELIDKFTLTVSVRAIKCFEVCIS